ncbi:MAG: hypothetical protein JW969_09170 [Spirochaetales bacterium]|nr:hypothetical protein [Spirochaetales bacterium]
MPHPFIFDFISIRRRTAVPFFGLLGEYRITDIEIGKDRAVVLIESEEASPRFNG